MSLCNSKYSQLNRYKATYVNTRLKRGILLSRKSDEVQSLFVGFLICVHTRYKRPCIQLS